LRLEGLPASVADLLREVVVLALLADGLQLGLDPVRVLLLANEDALEELVSILEWC